MKTILFLILLILCIHPAISQITPPSIIEATLTDERIKLDGDLSETVWQTAKKISNFTQRELHEGEPVTEKNRSGHCLFQE